MIQQSPAAPRVLPRKRVAAGALFLDEKGRVLLVNPTYKPQWEIPGGMVEVDESPLAACRREVFEELGLAIAPEQLLSVGYSRTHSPAGDGVRFIFWGGVLDETALAQIMLPAEELSEYRFFTLEETAEIIRPSLHAQLAQCLANLHLGTQPLQVVAPNYWEE